MSTTKCGYEVNLSSVWVLLNLQGPNWISLFHIATKNKFHEMFMMQIFGRKVSAYSNSVCLGQSSMSTDWKHKKNNGFCEQFTINSDGS